VGVCVCVGDALRHPFEVLPEFEGPVLGASMQQLCAFELCRSCGSYSCL